jgi:hypothetical protein
MNMSIAIFQDPDANTVMPLCMRGWVKGGLSEESITAVLPPWGRI